MEPSANRVPIGPGTQVDLRFTIKLGEEIIDSTGERCAGFVVGDGNLLPGFERAMFGMVAGEKGEFLIDAENGFGLRNPDNIQMMKRGQFSADVGLSEGLIVSFANQEKQELPGVIRRIMGDLVEVDFNHPLAGEDLIFEVEIVKVEQVSNEIVRA